jgi:AraC-like DNA-binding protein
VIEVQFETPDYTVLSNTLAVMLKAKPHESGFKIPPVYGNGYIWAEKLPCGISLMVADVAFREDFKMVWPIADENYFSLQFNESDGGKSDVAPYLITHSKAQIPLLHSSVLLTNATITKAAVIPAGVKLRLVHLYFNIQILSTFFPADVVEVLVNRQLKQIVDNTVLEPIETAYRIMLDELQVENHNHPLRINFIQNRILLLLEKFLLKVIARKETMGTKPKLSEDEIVRLMKVEALLVKDFSVAAPTIDQLSKLSAMSATKLKSDFKILYGLPIYEYYQKNRMLKAKALLLSSLYSSKEVGIMVGYTNLSHFATTFKKEFGVLPSELINKESIKYKE